MKYLLTLISSILILSCSRNNENSLLLSIQMHNDLLFHQSEYVLNEIMRTYHENPRKVKPFMDDAKKVSKITEHFLNKINDGNCINCNIELTQALDSFALKVREYKSFQNLVKENKEYHTDYLELLKLENMNKEVAKSGLLYTSHILLKMIDSNVDGSGGWGILKAYSSIITRNDSSFLKIDLNVPVVSDLNPILVIDKITSNQNQFFYDTIAPYKLHTYQFGPYPLSDQVIQYYMIEGRVKIYFNKMTHSFDTEIIKK